MAWRALLLAWLAAGTAFLLVNVLAMPLVLEIDGTLALRYFGALLLGPDVLLGDDQTPLIVGALVNYGLALVFTTVIAIVVHRWGLLVGLLGGAALGLSIYGINLYTMTVFFEWFFALNSVVLLASHVLFGLVAGGVYELFDTYDEGLNPGGAA